MIKIKTLIRLLTVIYLILNFSGIALSSADEEGKGKDKDKEKVIYKYKDYEKFEFDELDVNANKPGDGNLSITPREQVKFDNRLPLRKNFNPEMKSAIEKVK